VTDQDRLIGRIKPQSTLEISWPELIDQVVEKVEPCFRVHKATLLIGARVCQRPQVTRRGQSAGVQDSGTLRPEHVRQWPGTVTIGLREAMDETTRQPGIAKECHQRLGVECLTWLSEVRFKISDGDTQAWVESVVA
jgi:hypothetical protein